MLITPIANYEQRYKIDIYGRILNLANNTELTPTKNPNGYLKVGLANGDGSQSQFLVHRLVALHFLPNPYGYTQVNHKDGDKTNNLTGNLEWCSSQQNIDHALKTKLRKGYISADDKEKYLERVLAGEQVKDIASTIDVHPNTLSKMLRVTATRIGKKDAWNIKMKENRKNAAIRNLEKINN